MKRFFCIFFTGVLMMTGVVYGAEPEVRFWRDAEVYLEDVPIQKNGKWMVSLSDLERLTGSQAKDNGDFITFQKAVALKKETVAPESARAAYLLPDGTFFEMADGGYRKADPLAEVYWQEEELYLPCRELAGAMGYDVVWFKWNGQEVIELRAMEMPEVTLDVEYEKEEKRLKGTILNKEPQSFLFGYDFTLERMTENGWERVKEAEPQYIDDVGFTIYANRTEDNMDGITPVARRVYAELPAGQYRMGIPFSYCYYLQNTYGSPWDTYFENGEVEKLGWDFYYSTHWGEPDFYFEGAGLSTTDRKKDTHYMLYGAFAVK